MIEPTELGARISQPIELANAVAMREAGAALLAQSDKTELHFDMAAVAANSIALAVTLSWLGAARDHERTLRLTNLSDEFIGVIEFSGLADMFRE